MKAKKILLATVITATGLIVSCQKNNSTGGSGNSGSNSTGTTAAEVQTQSDDVTQVSNEMDAVNNDVNNSLNASATFSGATSYNGGAADGKGVVTEGGGGSLILDLSICDATVTTDTANGLRQIIITYNGLNCWGNRIRHGVVVISIPVGVRWRDSGAVVTVSIQNLKITRVRDQKTITLNGTYTYTNVTGGLLKDLATLGTITHTVSADSVTIQFADSATRIWSVAKQRVFTYNDGIVITTTGTHSDGTNNDVAIWGTNRYGNSFETLITQPMVIEQSCDFRLTSGQTETIRPALTLTITYGLDSNGDPTGCPGNGYYYFKAVWVLKDGRVYTYIAPY
ncbi:MAG TPA: hypothetical protein VG101_17010 [Puia sp.]|jgi:hypothetical protein|nr:hypothetical protein [Puia sp.]